MAAEKKLIQIFLFWWISFPYFIEIPQTHVFLKENYPSASLGKQYASATNSSGIEKHHSNVKPNNKDGIEDDPLSLFNPTLSLCYIRQWHLFFLSSYVYTYTTTKTMTTYAETYYTTSLY